MNYLGHATLSNSLSRKLIGNLIGDYVKGRIEHVKLDQDVIDGIELHRTIDTFTDQHPSCMRAKNIFRIDYKLYSGAIVDVLWDYFIANDPVMYENDKQLRLFSTNVYDSINEFHELLPSQAHELFDHLITEDWLYDIRTLRGLKSAYQRLMYRFNNGMTADAAYELTMRHYYELNQMYMEFIDDIKEKLKLL